MSSLSTPSLRSDSRAGPTGQQALATSSPRAWPAAAPWPQVSAELLTSLPLLCALEPGSARQLAQRAQLQRLPRHAMVIEQGSQEAGLFILLQGQAQVLRHNQGGRALLVDQLRPGDHFGELSAIDGQPQQASVRCTLPSEVLRIPRQDFIHCLHAAPGLLPALLQALVQRVRRKQRRITQLALHDVRGCVLQQLLDLAELHDGRPMLRGHISRQAIADMIGASRAMVSRVMMDLQRNGVLQPLADGTTAIHDPASDTSPPPAGRQHRQRLAS